ncbi:MAG: ABC transporter substrate-binding protein-like protein [Nitrospirae bacterium]|nr:MAG: ABC transporter substrate-binding protein-like protein [Nitrospirota bacterium]
MRRLPYFFILLVLALALNSPHAADSSQGVCRVMVVMSYHDEYVWQKEVRQGIEQVLAKKCELVYFNLNARNDPKNSPERAKEAFEFFRRYRPDAVIAADDAAQIHFVLPFLKEKAETPVVFIGVNHDASAYGYPAANVTGVVERFHVRETLALLKQLMPRVRTVGFLHRGDEPSTQGTYAQIRAELNTYPVKVVGFWEPKTHEETLAMAREIRRRADAVHVEQMEGIKDKNGRSYSNKEIISEIAAIWKDGPLVCGQLSSARYGCLCTVVESGVEQGMTGAKMVLQILGGTPVSKIPIARNHTGFKVINVSAMKKLGIAPEPVLLRGARLVTDED